VRSILPRLLLIGAILAAAAWATLNPERLNPAALDDRLASLGLWAPVVYVALYTVGAVVFLPGSLFALAGGALFGPVLGAALNLLAATIGASAAFIVARYVASDWVARKASGWLKQLIDGVEAEGWRFVAFVRLVPLFPFNLTNYALGLTRIGFMPYVVTSLVCMAPGAVAYTWLGHAGREAVAGDASAIRYGLLALGLLAAIALLPRLVRRWRAGEKGGWIGTDGLARLGEGAAIVDVRGPDEFAGPLGHIPGALNVPLDELSGRLSEINALKREPVILVCRTQMRSAKAATLMRQAGFGDVRVLRGGMVRWNDEGRPVVARKEAEAAGGHG
jgi:uncharacterized membrane protein YdjX (TVP38/TMEM64 family)/rhodanese-related sulfurtransferase